MTSIGSERETGTAELSRSATAYLVSAAFCITFLLCSLFGTSSGTALFRAAIVAGVALLIGRPLVRPAIDAILTAMARDRAEAERAAEEAEQ